MNQKTISKDEIQQLLFFMNRIRAFEETFLIQKDSITRLIWGLLLIGAGILDWAFFEMAFKTGEFGLFTILPWVIAIFSGLIIQIFSDRHITNIYSWERPKKEFNSDTLFLIAGFAIMAVLISYYNMNNISSLSFPSVALISGFMSLVMDRSYFKKNEEVLEQKLYLFIPMVCIVTAIVMTAIVLIDKSLFRFHGLIFGVTFGGSFSTVAFWNRKQVGSYIEKMDSSQSKKE
ncbi:MAG: hypothetical protein ACFFD4_32620 [Candidatus Odinarchaeota archaeon]